MFRLFSKAEITADGTEDALLHSLAVAMKARGFALLGIVALREADGALATFGQASITESAEFKEILRCLADQMEMTANQPADEIIPSA
jgi:hypothetical protein